MHVITIAITSTLLLLRSGSCCVQKRDISLWNTSNSDGRELSSSTSTGTAASNCCIPTNLPSPVSHMITVGFGGGKVFSPNEVDANPGDIIRFTFLKLNHTLTQSSFSQPCTNTGGFSTGFNQINPQNLSTGYVVDYLVTTLDPQWFFCAQVSPKSHCHAGMVFALNPGGLMSAFIAGATELSSTSTPTSSPTGSFAWQVGSSSTSQLAAPSFSFGSQQLGSAPNVQASSFGSQQPASATNVQASSFGSQLAVATRPLVAASASQSSFFSGSTVVGKRVDLRWMVLMVIWTMF